MKKLFLSFVVAAAVSAAAPALAGYGLSLRGDTGLARTPAAASLPQFSLATAVDYVSSDYQYIPVRIEVGLIKGLEVGASYQYLDAPGDNTIWGLNAKYVLPEFVENLGLGFGGHFRKQTIEDFENDGHDLYFVASYRLGPIVPALGVMYESITGDNDESDARFFGSVVVNVLPNFTVGGEIMTASEKLDGAGVNPSMWFGVRYLPIAPLAIQAGLLNNLDLGAGRGGHGDVEDFILAVGLEYAVSFVK